MHFSLKTFNKLLLTNKKKKKLVFEIIGKLSIQRVFGQLIGSGTKSESDFLLLSFGFCLN